LQTLKDWLAQNYYDLGREWVYKDIPPKIICEKHLGLELIDYKIFYFNGEPQIIQLDIDRYSNHSRSIYDTDWNLQPFSLLYPNYKSIIQRPDNLDEMLYVGRKLSKDIPFVRVDLYSIHGTIVFGEMTFFPGNGFEKFSPEEYDYEIGTLLDISSGKK